MMKPSINFSATYKSRFAYRNHEYVKILEEHKDICHYSKIQQEFRYYIKLHRLFHSWNGEGDFALLCKRNGLEFNEIAAYYYK